MLRQRQPVCSTRKVATDDRSRPKGITHDSRAVASFAGVLTQTTAHDSGGTELRSAGALRQGAVARLDDRQRTGSRRPQLWRRIVAPEQGAEFAPNFSPEGLQGSAPHICTRGFHPTAAPHQPSTRSQGRRRKSPPSMARAHLARVHRRIAKPARRLCFFAAKRAVVEGQVPRALASTFRCKERSCQRSIGGMACAQRESAGTARLRQLAGGVSGSTQTALPSARKVQTRILRTSGGSAIFVVSLDLNWAQTPVCGRIADCRMPRGCRRSRRVDCQQRFDARSAREGTLAAIPRACSPTPRPQPSSKSFCRRRPHPVATTRSREKARRPAVFRLSMVRIADSLPACQRAGPGVREAVPAAGDSRPRLLIVSASSTLSSPAISLAGSNPGAQDWRWRRALGCSWMSPEAVLKCALQSLHFASWPAPAETTAPAERRLAPAAEPQANRSRRFVRGGIPVSSAPAWRRLPSAATLPKLPAIPCASLRSDSVAPAQTPRVMFATTSQDIQSAPRCRAWQTPPLFPGKRNRANATPTSNAMREVNTEKLRSNGTRVAVPTPGKDGASTGTCTEEKHSTGTNTKRPLDAQ